MNGLRGGQVWMDPELIARLQVWNLRNVKSLRSACDADINTGADEVETTIGGC